MRPAETFNMWGPPGTGKTTKIVEMARSDAERYGRDQISICSLTNAAINEVKKRIDFLDDSNISTLHAQCKRSQGAPSPAESIVDQFISEYPSFGGTRYISESLRFKSGMSYAEMRLASTRGENVYEQVNSLRHRLVPESLWNLEQLAFYRRWKDFQKQTGHPDYLGWLEIAIETECLPQQQVVYVDEAQDHTPLQIKLVTRHWPTRKVYLVGDDDQNLYGFTGANARAFYSAIDNPGHETVLSQSYRVPKAVHRESTKLINKIVDRKKKEYFPRNAEGSVSHTSYSLENAKNYHLPFRPDEIEGSVMILASCGYHLDPMVKLLYESKIPFHNPYRTTNPKWNPLKDSLKKIKGFTKPERWSGKQAGDWAKNLRSEGVFIRGRKQDFLELCEHREKDLLYSYDLKNYFLEEPLARLLDRDLSIFTECSARVSSSWSYGLSIIDKYGQDVKPQIIIGTVHSVKGGEADHVYLAPDLSRAGYREYTGEHRPRILRLMYVGMTRARESLTLLHSYNPKRIRW